jgi:hypothetical protein
MRQALMMTKKKLRMMMKMMRIMREKHLNNHLQFSHTGSPQKVILTHTLPLCSSP